MVEPRLKVVGLTAGYKDNPVLSGLDLEIRPGEVVVVTGSNGSGKSTMLRCLAGLMGFEGVVEVDGEPLATASRSKVGYLPQHVTFPRWARVGDVLDYFARLRGTDLTVSVFPEGFVPAQAQPVRTLSGGQRQRLALAVALLGDPALILLDEPVASLDDASVPSLVKVIDRVAEAGGSVLVTSPRHEADSLGPDRVLRLQGGLVLGGTTAPYPTPFGRGAPFPQSFALGDEGDTASSPIGRGSLLPLNSALGDEGDATVCCSPPAGKEFLFPRRSAVGDEGDATVCCSPPAGQEVLLPLNSALGDEGDTASSPIGRGSLLSENSALGDEGESCGCNGTVTTLPSARKVETP